MTTRYDDIEDIIKEIEHIKLNLNDPMLGSVFWEEAMKSLIEKQGGKIVELLRELEKRRDKDEDRHI